MAVVSLAAFRTEPGMLHEHLALTTEATGLLRGMGLASVRRIVDVSLNSASGRESGSDTASGDTLEKRVGRLENEVVRLRESLDLLVKQLSRPATP